MTGSLDTSRRRGGGLMRRGLFTAYLAVILAGLGYFIVIGLLGR